MKSSRRRKVAAKNNSALVVFEYKTKNGSSSKIAERVEENNWLVNGKKAVYSKSIEKQYQEYLSKQ